MVHKNRGVTEADRKILQEGTVDFFSRSYYTSSCEAVDETHGTTAGNSSLGGESLPEKIRLGLGL